MMKLTYRRAILSVCKDLTDPGGRPIPIGVLLIGALSADGSPSASYADLDGSRWAGVVVLEPNFGDPFLAEHVTDAVTLVKEHINITVDENPDMPAEEILHGLYEMLRNTLSVTSISEEKSVGVHAANEELYGSAVIEVATTELKSELDDILKALQQEVKELRAKLPAGAGKGPRKRDVISQQTDVWAVG